MSRSVKKGPFASPILVKRINEMNENGTKKILKTWSRSTTILPEFVEHTISVYNGQRFIPVFVKSEMVGHKLGEFSPTRKFNGHKEKKAVKAPGKKG